MPEVYKCTQLPTTHFPPIVPMLEGCDDVQCLMMLFLCHQCMSSWALHTLQKHMQLLSGALFSPDMQ